MAADGSLRFDTKIDTEGFKEGTGSLKKAAESFQHQIEKTGKSINDAFENSTRITALENQISQTEEKIRHLTDEMKQMENAKVPTEEYAELSDLVGKTSLKLEGLLARQEKMDSQGVKHNSTRWQSLQYDIDETSKRLEIYKAELQDTIDQERAFTSGQDSAAYEKKAEALENLNNRLYVQKKRLSELIGKEAGAADEAARLKEIAENAEVSDQRIVDLNNRLQELKNRQKELQSAGVGLGFQEYDANTSEIAQITNELNQYKSVLQSAIKETESGCMSLKDSVMNAFKNTPAVFAMIPSALASAVSRIPAIAKNAFSKASHKAASFGKELGSSITNGAKRAVIGLKSLFNPANKASASILKLSNMFKLMLIRMAIRAAIEGVKEGMQNLVQYSSEANQSMSSLVSGATYMKNSFAAAFAPILSVVAPILNTLIDLLATALSYINQFFAALGGSTTFIKAKKVNEDYAKSIKGAGGAAKQAGKDAQKALAPFDELTVLQDQASSGSGGGGGGDVDPSQMFETATISDAVNGFAGQIRQAFEAGDWKELGTLIGQKFNEIVDGVDWSGIGHKIGYGVNGAVQTAYYALKAADFKNLGNHVAELINGALEEIDFTFVGRLLVRGFTAEIDFLIGLLGGLNWGLIGKSVGDFLRGAFDEAYEWITGYDWSQMAHNLYSNIKECLLGVDFSSLAESFFKALGAALGAAVSFVASFVGDIWKDINKYFSSYLTNDDGTKKCGLDWVAGILEGIWDGIKNIGSWIWEHVAQPLIQGFKDAFGIHSPSTVMAELAGYLMEGLLNKITEMMPDVVSKFGELKENISTKWEEIKAAASEKWSGIQSTLSGFWNGIKESAGTVFGQAGDSISKVWEDVKKKTSDLWGKGGIQGVISGAVSGIISGVEGMVNAIIRAINGLINNINKLSIDIPDTPFSDGFTLGFNLPTLSEVHLPRLASGTVVPPRAGEFAAILGDNNREAEIVSPISAMKQAFREAVEEMQGIGVGDIQLTVNLDGKVIYNDVVKRNQQTTERTGKNPLLT